MMVRHRLASDAPSAERPLIDVAVRIRKRRIQRAGTVLRDHVPIVLEAHQVAEFVSERGHGLEFADREGKIGVTPRIQSAARKRRP